MVGHSYRPCRGPSLALPSIIDPSSAIAVTSRRFRPSFAATAQRHLLASVIGLRRVAVGHRRVRGRALARGPPGPARALRLGQAARRAVQLAARLAAPLDPQLAIVVQVGRSYFEYIVVTKLL